jgi:hypothetical protein
MEQTPSVEQFYGIQKRFCHLHDTGLSWRQIGDMYSISKATARDVAKGREPKRPDLRAAIGLPPLATVERCTCGEVHTMSKCPNRPKRKRPRINADVAFDDLTLLGGWLAHLGFKSWTEYFRWKAALLRETGWAETAGRCPCPELTP